MRYVYVMVGEWVERALSSSSETPEKTAKNLATISLVGFTSWFCEN